MSNVNSSEGAPVSRRDVIKGGLGAAAGIAASRIDVGVAHALPEQSSELVGEVSLRQIAESKSFEIGGVISSTARSPYKDDFTRLMFDGILHPNRMASSPDPEGYDFSRLDSSLQILDSFDLDKAEIHHVVQGYYGRNGKPIDESRIAHWMPEEIAKHGGDPIPVLDKHITNYIDHMYPRYADKIATLTVVNEPLNWDGGYYSIDYGNNISWNNLWNQASEASTGDPRDYVIKSLEIADREILKRVDSVHRPTNLIVNEWGAEMPGTPKGDAYRDLIHHVAGQSAPIDGAGFQMHLWPGDENHAYIFHDGTSLALRNEAEIVYFADLFRQHAQSLPEGVPPFITEMSIDDSGWKNMGYTEEDIKYLQGRTLYHITKALVDAGGRSLMLYEPRVISKKDPGEPIHQLAAAISEIPSK